MKREMGEIKTNKIRKSISDVTKKLSQDLFIMSKQIVLKRMKGLMKPFKSNTACRRCKSMTVMADHCFYV